MPISTFDMILRNYRTKRQAPSSDFTRSFLKNKCGISGKKLVSASGRVSFGLTDKRPCAVLQLLRRFGFSVKHYTRIISYDSRLLRCDAQKTLKPKLDFLLSVCNNREMDLHKIVSISPCILHRSLDEYLVPTLNLLASALGNYKNVVIALKRSTLLLKSRASSVSPNVKLLQTLGVPHSRIFRLIIGYRATAPLYRCSDEFRIAVLKAMEMGFDPKSSSLVNAVTALLMCNNDLLHGIKSKLFRSFGFSEDEIIFVFKKQPLCFILSAGRTRRIVEFLMNNLCWSPSRIAFSPNVMLYSLEKRTIPRCSVLQVLGSRNIISNRSLLSVLVMTEREFLKDFVVEHQDKVPEGLGVGLRRCTYNLQYKLSLSLCNSGSIGGR
ncbi:hypothetical protein ACET3Z_003528 [Daucus carota]